MEELLQAAQRMPKNLINNLVSYAKFLKFEYKPLLPDKDGWYRKPELLKGRIFMSDDFDELHFLILNIKAAPLKRIREIRFSA